jgi:aspartyl-tRNA(Asn)/glutamyl-tRNA(Gln) amidotransferase subunit C
MLHDRIARIAELARLDPEPATLDRFGRECMNVLGYIDVLGEIDAAGVEPLYSPLEQADAFRPDDVEPDSPESDAQALDQRAAMLANAPETDGVFFIVPRIV